MQSSFENFDVETLDRCAELFFADLRPDELVATKFISTKKNEKPEVIVGFFDSIDEFKLNAKKAAGQFQCYVGLNPVSRTILNSTGHSVNEVKRGSAAKEEDITRLRFLLIDLDTIREKNCPASNAELNKTRDVAKSIEEFLNLYGLSYIRCGSGNGIHILLPVAQENGEPEKGFFKEVLKYLDQRFSTDDVKVDTGNFDAIRVTKIYGTKSIKGNESENRPHRLANIEFETETLDQNDLLVFCDFISVFTETSQESDTKDWVRLKEKLERANLYLEPYTAGKHKIKCPWESQHSEGHHGNSSTVVFDGSKNGHIGFKCFHLHCRDKRTRDLYRFLDGDTVETKKSKLNFISVDDLYNEVTNPIEYVVHDLLALGTTSLLIGKPKSGKTTFARNLIHAVATGSKFLSSFDCNKGLVLNIALEEHKEFYKENLRLLGVQSDAQIYTHFYAINSIRIEDLLLSLQESVDLHKPSLIVIDTLFKFAKVKDSSAYAEIGHALEPITDFARQNNVHICCVHHEKKQSTGAVDSALGSTAITGAVDTILRIDLKDKKRLLNITQRYGISYDEQNLEFDSEKQTLKINGDLDQIKIEESKAKIVNLLAKGPYPSDELQALSGLRKQTYHRALESLLKSERILRSGPGTKGDPYIYKMMVPKTHVQGLTHENI